jgi:hypothetical protein
MPRNVKIASKSGRGRPGILGFSSDLSSSILHMELEMAASQTTLGKALVWGVITAGLYWFLFQYSGGFEKLAHTTLDACLVQDGGGTTYYNKVTPELCAAQSGTFIEGTWWYVFGPIALAFALSYTHGIFTGLFWDVVGLKAKK